MKKTHSSHEKQQQQKCQKRISRFSLLRFFNGSTTTTPEIKYHVISPAIETNVNRILFKVERNFTSGLM